MASGNLIGGALLLGASLIPHQYFNSQSSDNVPQIPVVDKYKKDTSKGVLTIISEGKITEVTINLDRIVGKKPECRNINGKEIYVVNGGFSPIIYDNPFDSYKKSKITYNVGYGEISDCDMYSSSCTISINDYQKRIAEIFSSPKCGDNQIASN